MLLDIIITHWQEPWDVGRKMFEMIRMQRGIRHEDFRVIFVQDGETGEPDLDRMTRVYPFVQETVRIPASGVSAARNAGMDASDAEWIMFCDFDDCFYSLDSLYRVIQSLKEAGDRADLVYGPFWIEMRKDGAFAKTLRERTWTVIHGKCFRRQYLIEHGLRFREDLSYSEDTLFCETFAMDVDPARIAKMPETVYMWCYREASLSTYEAGEARRVRSLYRKRQATCEEYEKRGRNYDAWCSATRSIFEYYFETVGGKRPDGISADEWRGMPKTFLRRWPMAVYNISQADRIKLFEIVENSAKLKGQYIGEGKPSFSEWVFGLEDEIRREEASASGH